MNRELILDTVIEMIKEGKADTISMSKIANRANIGKSTIYEYFETKEELMSLALKKLINKYVDMFLQTPFGDNTFLTFKEHILTAIRIRRECIQIFDISKLNSVSFFSNEEIVCYMKKRLCDMAFRIEEICHMAIEEGIVIPKRDFLKQKYIIYGLIKGSFICNQDNEYANDETFINDLYENLLVLLNN